MEIEVPGKALEIYKRLKTRFDAAVKEGKMKQISGLTYDDSKCMAEATGTGFKSKIKCVDGKVVVDLDLSLFLKPLRGQIEDGIRKSITKAMS